MRKVDVHLTFLQLQFHPVYRPGFGNSQDFGVEIAVLHILNFAMPPLTYPLQSRKPRYLRRTTLGGAGKTADPPHRLTVGLAALSLIISATSLMTSWRSYQLSVQLGLANLELTQFGTAVHSLRVDRVQGQHDQWGLSACV